MPVISIVTISYNAAVTIEETIKSVLSQKTDDVEYIIVDGNSNDGTIDIISQYKNEIDRIIIEKDEGISDAFNKGIKAASGKVIGLLNADDVLNEGAIYHLLSAIDDETDVYRGEIYIWNDKTNERKILKPSLDMLPRGQRVVVAHPGTYITKAAYERYGYYDTKCKIKMDEDLLIRFAKNNVKAKYVPFCMVNFRLGGVSTRKEHSLKKYKTSLKETLYIYKKNGVGILGIFREFIRLSAKYLLRKL